MADIEDAEDYYFATEVLERLRKGEERVFTAQEVREDLGLEVAPLPEASRWKLTAGNW